MFFFEDPAELPFMIVGGLAFLSGWFFGWATPTPPTVIDWLRGDRYFEEW